jgi:excisionase family DNA binding protein
METCLENFDLEPNTPDALPEKRCYTVEDLQVMLAISRPTVYNLLKKHEFNWFQIGGGQYRISKRSFDAWLDQRL